ncbi:hypothetical protein [Agromyces sp. Leaf222]|uniref:hypothetical protein n=1 Tax=Agromyces sp. Leaf222 TaxID=1735688 RepID=UPI0006F62268|nr:hypothetical protein [Agromyces sp. Leaf222]KQM83771.1 hypothetical protein ASE68_11630 [Agromyces sp. Leaf222]
MSQSIGVGRTPAAGSEPAPFDVRGFARTAQGSLRDDLELDAMAQAGLARDAVRTVATLAELEGATMEHLRNVLVTPTHKDAMVTAFLVSWAYEKYWIADALRLIAGATGARDAAANPSTHTAAATTGRASAGRGPIRRSLAGFGQGPDVVGAHLALGFVDDLVLDLAYARLAAEAIDGAGTPNPAFGDAIARIRTIKLRHTEFFAGEARRRMAASSRAARLGRGELARSAWPLGSGSVATGEREAFAQFAVADAESRSALARGIRSLPGVGERTTTAVLRRLGA